jgi:hypothetical protein
MGSLFSSIVPNGEYGTIVVSDGNYIAYMTNELLATRAVVLRTLYENRVGTLGKSL